jgi:DNA-binding response OmpR family regulator
MRAESEGPGKGAQFFVELNTRGVEEAEAAPARSAPESVANGTSHSQATVLLVEDHADSARLLGRNLQRAGYRVLLAHSVKEALEVFSGNEVHAVISDIGLPDGNGTDLLVELRKTRPVPAIALSGYGMEMDHHRSITAGFSEHLTKPIDWTRLEQALQRILASHGGIA